MKIKFKRIIKITIIYLSVLLVLSIILANIDYHRTKNNKPPILAQHLKILNKKENVKIWHGLGYIVVQCQTDNSYILNNDDSTYKLYFMTYNYICVHSFTQSELGQS